MGVGGGGLHRGESGVYMVNSPAAKGGGEMGGTCGAESEYPSAGAKGVQQQ